MDIESTLATILSQLAQLTQKVDSLSIAMDEVRETVAELADTVIIYEDDQDEEYYSDYDSEYG